MVANLRKPNLSFENRNAIAQFLFKITNSYGKLGRGKISEAAKKWGVSRWTVQEIWCKAKKQVAEGLPIFLTNGKIGIAKKKKIVSMESVMDIPAAERRTIRALAKSLSNKGIVISKTAIGRMVKAGLFRAHTNSIKPDLTATNRLLRLKWSLSALYVDEILNNVKFKSMNTTIHIDEKWFFMTQSTSRYYLCEGEEPVYRSCKSKSHITKVMFVCAVGRPCYDNSGDLIFDGKIGMYPLTIKVPAQRRSKNREAGTIETKAIDSVTKMVYKKCIIEQIIPAIKAKWPANASKTIILQQDNARPHITNDDEDFREAATKDGFNFILVNQPPQSPDCNINDLGWFRAIQSLQQESPSYSIDEMVSAVEQSFLNLEPSKLNKVFLTLQSCMVEIMKQRGHNNYRTPHMKKDQLIRQGRLPRDLEVDRELVKDCIDYLLEVDQVHGLEDLMSKLGY